MTDKTTGETPSHLTNPANDAGQVIGYSHSTRLPKYSNQVAGYRLKLFVALITGLTLSFPVAAKLYKWVDNQGTTHYGETVPPEYAGKDRMELNEEGRVIKNEEVITPERRLAKEQEDAKKRADAKAALDQQRRDRTLDQHLQQRPRNRPGTHPQPATGRRAHQCHQLLSQDSERQLACLAKGG